MRTNYIDWDNYFMMVSLVSGLRSKDPSTQVGACIVSQDKKIIGVGYNGLPTGCNDKDYPWDVREGQLPETKYPYICHAELNAILNSTVSVKGATIYVSLFPCNECAKAIIQSGIKEIVYLSDKYKETDTDKISRRMLDDAGVKYRKITLSHNIELYPRPEDSIKENFININQALTPVKEKEEEKRKLETITKEKKETGKENLIVKEIGEYQKSLYVIDRRAYSGTTDRLNKFDKGTIIKSSSGELLLCTEDAPSNCVTGCNVKRFKPEVEIYFITDGVIKDFKNLSLELNDANIDIAYEIKKYCNESEVYKKLDNVTLFVYNLPLFKIYELNNAIKEYDHRHVFHVAYMPVSNRIAGYYYIEKLKNSLIGRVVYSVKDLSTLHRIYFNEMTDYKERMKKKTEESK